MTGLEKILEEIETHRKFAYEHGNLNVVFAFESCANIIRKRMNDGWIPVEECLPEEGEMVLVTCQKKSGQRSVNRAWHMGGFWHGTGSMSGVIAWMPLPEPYRPEKKCRKDIGDHEERLKKAREKLADIPGLYRLEGAICRQKT